jgi:putative ABC transport system permease protein
MERKLVYLFARDFIKLLLITYMVAFLLVYYVIHQWLSAFAFHITPGWDIFVAPLVLLWLISLSTVAVICLRVATANPTASLRQE